MCKYPKLVCVVMDYLEGKRKAIFHWFDEILINLISIWSILFQPTMFMDLLYSSMMSCICFQCLSCQCLYGYTNYTIEPCLMQNTNQPVTL